MHTFQIAKKLLQQIGRQKGSWIIYIAFPLAMIFILGSVFGGTNPETPPLSIQCGIYSLSGKGSALAAGLTSVEAEGIRWSVFDDLSEAEEALKSGRLTSLILIDERVNEGVSEGVSEGRREVTISGGSDQDFQVLSAIIKSTAAWSSVYTLLSPGSFARLNEPVVQLVNLSPQKESNLLDFFGVTMVTMFILYGSYFAASGIQDERRGGTLGRILTAPVSGGSILLGTSLGSLAASLLQILILIGVGGYLFGVNYGSNYPLLIAILAAESLLAMSFGLLLSVLIRNHKIVETVLNISILAMVFIGGGFVPLGDSGIPGIITRLSPVRWINQALFTVIHNGPASTIVSALLICLIPSMIFLFFGSITFIKKEAV